MRVLRTVFQDLPESERGRSRRRMMLVLDFDGGTAIETQSIADLSHRIEAALPGMLDGDENCAHSCGAAEREHSFRGEIEQGTTIPHLLEHLILFMLGRANGGCTGITGQRSRDLDLGVSRRYYVVTDYSDKVQAVVAADLACQLVGAWMAGRTVRLDAGTVLRAVNSRVAAMLNVKA